MSGKGYYARGLSGRRLERCYALAPPRVRQYLDAECAYVREQMNSEMIVLELGCGYGRVALRLADVAHRVVGIDTAVESLRLAVRLAGGQDTCRFVQMDATALGFDARVFDLVVCVQNGICAFQADPAVVLREALRVTRVGGRVLASSYAARFWPHRLEWFERQAAHGLVGGIDRELTMPGVIVCRDGFRSGTMDADDFAGLCANLGVQGRGFEVDGSSLFCDIRAAA